MSRGDAGAAAAEVTALQGLLAAEHAAAWGWGVAGAHLRDDGRALAREAVTAHLARRDRLRALLWDRGAEPVAAAAAYELPEDVDSPAAALRLALALEEGTAAAQARALSLLEPAALRAALVSALTAAAVRATRVRALLDPAGPLTVPFPGQDGLPTPLPPPSGTPAPAPSTGGASRGPG